MNETFVYLNDSDFFTLENCSYSPDPHMRERFPLIGIVMASACAFGISGNLLVIAVLLQPRMRSASAWFLTALAAFDTSVMMETVLLYIVEIFYDYSGSLALYRAWFSYVRVIYVLSHISQVATVSLTLGATIERYLSLSPSLQPCWQASCNGGRAVLWIFGLTILLVVPLTISKYWEIRIQVTPRCAGGFGEFELRASWLLADPTYNTVYSVWISNVVFIFLPFALLAVMNSLIFVRMRQQHHHSMKKAQIANKLDGYRDDTVPYDKSGNSPRREKLARRNREETVVLLVVVLVFLLCNVPSVVLTIAEFFFLEILHSYDLLYALARDSINLLTVINSSSNFVIYLIFGAEYRREIRRLLCCGRDWKPRRSLKQRQTPYCSLLLTCVGHQGNDIQNIDANNNIKNENYSNNNKQCINNDNNNNTNNMNNYHISESIKEKNHNGINNVRRNSGDECLLTTTIDSVHSDPRIHGTKRTSLSPGISSNQHELGFSPVTESFYCELTDQHQENTHIYHSTKQITDGNFPDESHINSSHSAGKSADNMTQNKLEKFETVRVFVKNDSHGVSCSAKESSPHKQFIANYDASNKYKANSKTGRSVPCDTSSRAVFSQKPSYATSPWFNQDFEAKDLEAHNSSPQLETEPMFPVWRSNCVDPNMMQQSLIDESSGGQYAAGNDSTRRTNDVLVDQFQKTANGESYSVKPKLRYIRGLPRTLGRSLDNDTSSSFWESEEVEFKPTDLWPICVKQPASIDEQNELETNYIPETAASCYNTDSSRIKMTSGLGNQLQSTTISTHKKQQHSPTNNTSQKLKSKNPSANKPETPYL